AFGATEQSTTEQNTPGERERVLAEHFALMREFLRQQEDIVQRLSVAHPTGALSHDASAAASSTHANDTTTPLLDAIVERDEAHVVARCHVGLRNDAFIRDHILSGPVAGSDSELFGLACVPLMASLEMMAEACALLAGHAELCVIENVKAYDWVTLDE